MIEANTISVVAVIEAMLAGRYLRDMVKMPNPPIVDMITNIMKYRETWEETGKGRGFPN